MFHVFFEPNRQIERSGGPDIGWIRQRPREHSLAMGSVL